MSDKSRSTFSLQNLSSTLAVVVGNVFNFPKKRPHYRATDSGHVRIAGNSVVFELFIRVLGFDLDSWGWTVVCARLARFQ